VPGIVHVWFCLLTLTPPYVPGFRSVSTEPWYSFPDVSMSETVPDVAEVFRVIRIRVITAHRLASEVHLGTSLVYIV
jgi:hypothetical protein